MKLIKKRRSIVFLSVIALCVLIWIWRYIHVNQFYENHTTKDELFFVANEAVYFEDDYLALHQSAADCYIMVNSLQIVDTLDYLKQNDISVANRQTILPEKLALVHITLCNQDSDAAYFFLPNFSLFGVDSNPQLDTELLPRINPILQNGCDVTLLKGAECKLTLPYMLFQNTYRRTIWNTLDSQTFFLQVTAFPTTKYIQMEGT